MVGITEYDPKTVAYADDMNDAEGGAKPWEKKPRQTLCGFLKERLFRL